jgi:hypothetical protein
MAAAGAIVAGALIATPAVGQDVPTIISGKVTVTPSKAGTPKKPQGHKLRFNVKWETPGDVEKPIVQKADVWFPQGSLYNGAKYPKCSESVLNRHGPSKCPKGSIMGTGSGTAWADDVITRPKITVVNGGANKVFLYTTMNNPARVQAPVPGTITKLSGGKWRYKLHLEVPRVLQIVAGVPIALRDLTITVGHKDWVASTGCPRDGRWPFEVQTYYSTGGSSKFSSSVRCR